MGGLLFTEIADDKIAMYNFWIEYAIRLKQVSTCFWDNSHQFCIWFEQFECCMGDL